mmetsp:Transcript_103366/g.287903  ORF Transcript_103366/g.287903 Transcript_103366/m.287903 type:complete len:109 (+) Transcript_103366:182-508(+)
MSKLRERQWLYIGPIAAAPIAHIAVTMYRSSRSPLQRRMLLGFGVVGGTALAVGMRLALMRHSAEPHVDPRAAASRVVHVQAGDEAGRRSVEAPALGTVLKEAARGFG